MAWTSDRVETIKRHAKTHTAAQIGEMLGCSRNAVLGYAHRNGISLWSQEKALNSNTPPPRGGGRPKGAAAKTKPSHGLRHSHRVRLTAVAARLAGASYTKAARLAGCSPQSIMNNWMRDGHLVAEARQIAEAAVADAARRVSQRIAAEQEARARVRAWNEGIARRSRHERILLTYLDSKSMADAGSKLGITRERVRQIVVAYEQSHGFIRHTERRERA